MTYREQFGTMPSLKHDKDPAKSQVINHIATTLAIDIERATRVFDDIRKRILIYDKIDCTWSGIDHRANTRTDKARIERLEIRLATLERAHKKLLAAYRFHRKHEHPKE